MIQSWRGKEAEAIFEGRFARGVHPDIARAARRRLAQLDQAAAVDDMRAPPGNRLHPVADRWSVSVNDQFRITLIWGRHGPEEVWSGDDH